MLKKLVVFLLVATIFLALGAAAYASPFDTAPSGSSPSVTEPQQSPEEKAAEEAKAKFNKMLSDILSDGNAINTDSLYVVITRPENDTDSTYEKSYVISGVAKVNVRVCLAKYNEETREYKPFKNKDGKSVWDVAEGKAFSKEILLDKGANKIKIVAYSTADISTLKQGDLQVNSFTISMLEKSVSTVIKDTINNVTNGITESFKNLIKP